MTPRSMDKTASRVSDERLAEMFAGLEGAVPGPWFVREYSGKSSSPYRMVQDENRMLMCIESVPEPTAAHIARCDPDTIRSILTELQHRRSLSSDSVSDGSKGVRVKPLKWQMERPDGTRWTGVAPLSGQYTVRHTGEAWEVYSGMLKVGAFALPDVAKAAAQTDYEQRIWSALDSGTGGQQPVSVLSSRTVALEIWERLAGFLPPVYSPNGGTCPPSIIAAADAIMEMASPTEPKAGVVVTDEMVADIATALWRPDIPAEVRVVAHAALRKALTEALNGDKP